MAERTHYQALGVPRTASNQEIRSAYRKLVVQVHPDRNPSAAAKERFLVIQAAYDVLSDEELRRTYDQQLLKQEAAPKVRRSPTPPKPREPEPTKAPTPRTQAQADADARGDLAPNLMKLTHYLSRAKYAEAEKLARQILDRDPRQPVPYAVLGDVHRFRGELKQAAKMYSYAAQMSPTNDIYQRKHEEILRAMQRQSEIKPTAGAAFPTNTTKPLAGSAVVIMASSIFVVLVHGEPMFQGNFLIGSWTLALVLMLVISGIALGAGLALSGLLDNFLASHTAAITRLSPTVVLGVVAAINFWFAAILYGGIGLSQNAFNTSASRVITGVGLTTIIFTLAVGFGQIEPFQVFLWGGNLLYIGSLCGWMVADSFRE